MVQQNEKKAMTSTDIYFGAGPVRHMILPLRVCFLRHLQILLVLAICAGFALSANTTTASSTSVPTAQSGQEVIYFIEVSVDVIGPRKDEQDIVNWLQPVFQNSLQSCGHPLITTSAATVSTITIASTTSETNVTNKSHTATSVTAVTATSSSAATSTATTSNMLTTQRATSATASQTDQIASSRTSTQEKNTTNENPSNNNNHINNNNGNSENNLRIARSISATANGIFKGLEVSCVDVTSIRNTTCFVTLTLTEKVNPCCILHTFCAASKSSTSIIVTGKSAERAGTLQPTATQCSNLSEDICVYTGPTEPTCEESEPFYLIALSNSTHCGAENKCNCTAYCSKTDAYYVFSISTENPLMTESQITALLSTIRAASECSSCPSPDIAAKYKDSSINCTKDLSLNCIVVSVFTEEVPICALSNLVATYLNTQSINMTGILTRAAICGNTMENDAMLFQSSFKLVEVNLTPDEFCNVPKETKLFICQPEESVIAMLNEQCVQTTATPNMTTALQPHTTLNTTLQPNTTLNTTTLQPNTTLNATILQPNTTLNITTTFQPNITLNASTTLPHNTTLNMTSTFPPNTSSDTTTTSQPNSTKSTTTLQPNTTLIMTTSLQPSTTTQSANETTTIVASTTKTIAPTTTDSSLAAVNAMLELTQNASQLNSSQVEQIVSRMENFLAGPSVSIAVANICVGIVNNLLSASPEALANSNNRIIGIVESIGQKVDFPATGRTNSRASVTLLSNAVAVAVQQADGTDFQGTFFSISGPFNVQIGNSRAQRAVKEGSTVPQGSVRLPPSLTQILTAEQQQMVTRVQFSYYQNSTLFQDKAMGNRALNSGIIGASVSNLTISDLKENVIIHLRNLQPIPANYVATCVFWDLTFNDGSGGWNSAGCSLQNSTDDETICGCNHLTSFGILLDLSRGTITSRLQATILTFITYIGCGISAIFLAVTLLTYLAFGKLRKDIPSKILIHLCMALLLLNLVFLVDAWLALYPEAVGLCISTAWFLHYFLLVAFSWMGLEAVHMYIALVKVFNSHISYYMLKFSLAGWGIPMIVVIIVIAINKDNYGLVSYGRFSDGTTDEFCWIKNDVAFYVAVVAYFCVIFLFNMVMFIVVLVQLRRVKKQNPHNLKHRTTLQDVRSVLGITILLGLTWGFAFFAWGPLNLPFMYLFAIFNSLQGFFIFVFHCAVKENVRRQWRTYLCCGQMRLAENSEWSRTATQKTAKKSSVSRITSLQSSKSNNLSSSTSYLVSDSSDQVNGFGSPFSDRTITADEDPSMDVILNELNSQYRRL